MAKTSQKTKTEVEHLRGENRELRKRLRGFEKRNKQLEKWFRGNELDLEKQPVEEEIIISEDSCPSCKKGKTTVIDMLYFYLTTCNSCDYKDRTKTGAKDES